MTSLLSRTPHSFSASTSAYPTRWSGRRKALVGVAAVLVTLILGYLALRPWHLRWGATDAEAAASLPGDLAGQRWTRAVTIAAAPEQIWPWLVQWGQGRGGWYSYDWIENALGFNIHSADRIRPDLQHLAVGDPICLADGVCFMNVWQIEPGRHLIFQGRDPQSVPFWTFALVLTPVDATHTRLIVRESFSPDALPAAALVALEIPDVVMELKMLDTLRTLAEGGAHTPWTTAAEVTVWIAALACGFAAGGLCLRRADWRLPLVLGLAAVLTLLVLTFLFPPVWLRALLDLALAAGVWSAWRRPQPVG